MRRSVLAASLLAMLGAERLAPAQETRRLDASEVTKDFGWSSAVSNEYALVGSPLHDSGGAAFLFDTETGQQLRKLVASDGAYIHRRFGTSVAISGDIAVVGDRRGVVGSLNCGAAYVFDLATGLELRKLTSPDSGFRDGFGCSVAMSEGLALIGAELHVSNGLTTGAAYLFDVTTGQQLQKFTPSDGNDYDFFGCSVALDGTIAVIGARRNGTPSSGPGTAYVFDVTTGKESFRLKASDGAAEDEFGTSVALSGDLAVVGAHLNDAQGIHSGAAYVFDVTTGQELSKLTASDGAAGQEFGWATARSGRLAVIGARYHDGGDGKVYVFDVTTGQELVGPDLPDCPVPRQLGHSVAIWRNSVLAGAITEHRATDMGLGVAYLFKVPGETYGAGCPGSGGVIPTHAIRGDSSPGGVITVEIRNAVGGSVAFIVAGSARASIPLGAGCFLNVAPPIPVVLGPIYLFPFHGSGAGIGWLEFDLAIPSSAPPGLSFTTQAFIVDGGAPRGFASTNGVEAPYQ